MTPATFPTLFEQYSHKAMRLATRLLGSHDAAADAVQEGLIKAYQAFARFEDGNLHAWFLCIVTNTCYDHLRIQKRQPTDSLEELTEAYGGENLVIACCSQATPDQQFLQKESLQAVFEVIEQLPTGYRVVLQRIDIEGYEYNEVAEELQIPLGTVKSRLHRARVIVRNQLVTTGMME